MAAAEVSLHNPASPHSVSFHASAALAPAPACLALVRAMGRAGIASLLPLDTKDKAQSDQPGHHTHTAGQRGKT